MNNCSVCHCDEELVLINDQLVCQNCKQIVLQKIKENVKEKKLDRWMSLILPFALCLCTLTYAYEFLAKNLIDV